MKQMEKTIRELVNQLNQASDAYYNGGREIMSNKEYDSRYEQLSKLEQETGWSKQAVISFLKRRHCREWAQDSPA